MARLNINGKTRDIDVEPDTPLLWVLREQVGLTGTTSRSPWVRAPRMPPMPAAR